MSKRLILILVLAFVACSTMAAFAEVQNIKVSGDLLFRAINRTNFSLTGDNKYKVSGLISDVRVRFDADLTDKVSATVRLLNERAWGNDLNYNFPTSSERNESDKVTIDLAYATLKEFFYAPLTLTVGRQELRFGNAMIIGDVDTNNVANELGVPWDLSLRKSFDAVRATLDYDPMVVDLVYSKIQENDGLVNNWWYTFGREKTDSDLYGMNTRFNLSSVGVKGGVEGYFWTRTNRSLAGVVSVPIIGTPGLQKRDTCNTIGGLFYAEIIKNLTGSIEGAFQFGNSNTWAVLGKPNAQRRAFAGQATLNYAFGGKYMPNLGVMYAIFSGDKTPTSKYNRAWDPMFEDQSINSITNAIFPNTNVRYAVLRGDLKPLEDVTVSGAWGYYWLDRPMAGGFIPSIYGSTGLGAYMQSGERYLGQALDVTATYDYTEDVQFGLTFGYFNPGDALQHAPAAGLEARQKTNATQVIGSMKVTF